jgi:hypothetical protein
LNATQRLFLLLAVAASAVAAVGIASIVRHGHVRSARDLKRTEELHSWENEGGNL